DSANLLDAKRPRLRKQLRIDGDFLLPPGPTAAAAGHHGKQHRDDHGDFRSEAHTGIRPDEKRFQRKEGGTIAETAKTGQDRSAASRLTGDSSVLKNWERHLAFTQSSYEKLLGRSEPVPFFSSC